MEHLRVVPCYSCPQEHAKMMSASYMLSLMGYARHAVVLCLCMHCIMPLASNATEGLLSSALPAWYRVVC